MKKLLTELDKGEKGRITKILSGIESSAGGAGHGHGAAKHFDRTLLKFEGQTEPKIAKRLKNLGVQVGKDLTVIAKQPFGPIVIEIDDIQTAIGRGMAHKIYVDKYETTRLHKINTTLFLFHKKKTCAKRKTKNFS